MTFTIRTMIMMMITIMLVFTSRTMMMITTMVTSTTKYKTVPTIHII
ncbi:hypothetical protein ABEP50_22310 [Priestia megaterium]